jgi:hypothetical protein
VHLLYIDESGSTERLDCDRDATPVMVILGLIVDARRIPLLTPRVPCAQAPTLPKRYGRGPALNHILIEVKGNEVLRSARSVSRDRRRHAAFIRREVLSLVERHGCRIVGRVWVKAPGVGLKPEATYCFAVQDIAAHFGEFLRRKGSRGVLIADSREQGLNVTGAHSIFTQKWRTAGDPYRAVAEVPLFAHSDNHVGLQLADLLASTVVFPMACAAYGAPMGNVHASTRYQALRVAHCGAVRDLQFRYQNASGTWRGGIVMSDPAGKRPGSLLFQP